jgi:hypothetical protein
MPGPKNKGLETEPNAYRVQSTSPNPESSGIVQDIPNRGPSVRAKDWREWKRSNASQLLDKQIFISSFPVFDLSQPLSQKDGTYWPTLIHRSEAHQSENPAVANPNPIVIEQLFLVKIRHGIAKNTSGAFRIKDLTNKGWLRDPERTESKITWR